MLTRSRQAIIKRLLDALGEWDCCPAYERRWITGWIRTTGCLMEQCNRSDDQGARIPFDAAADLLTEVALALNELRPMLEEQLGTISCPECDDEIEANEAACNKCLWLARMPEACVDTQSGEQR